MSSMRLTYTIFKCLCTCRSFSRRNYSSPSHTLDSHAPPAKQRYVRTPRVRRPLGQRREVEQGTDIFQHMSASNIHAGNHTDHRSSSLLPSTPPSPQVSIYLSPMPASHSNSLSAMSFPDSSTTLLISRRFSPSSVSTTREGCTHKSCSFDRQASVCFGWRSNSGAASFYQTQQCNGILYCMRCVRSVGWYTSPGGYLRLSASSDTQRRHA